MGARHFNQGFGYAIDYDEAIAYDRLVLGQIQRQLELEQHFTDEDRACLKRGAFSPEEFLMLHPEHAGLFGTEVSHVYDLCFERGYEETVPASHQLTSGWYQRAQALSKRLGQECGGYFFTDAKKALSKAKASLARHLRNQKKHGS